MESVLKSKARRLRSSFIRGSMNLKQELWTLMCEMKFLYTFKVAMSPLAQARANENKLENVRPTFFKFCRRFLSI